MGEALVSPTGGGRAWVPVFEEPWSIELKSVVLIFMDM